MSQVLQQSVFIHSASTEKFDDPWPSTPWRRCPCFHHVACGLLQCHACRITSIHNWHISTCAECCSSSRLWYTQVWARL